MTTEFHKKAAVAPTPPISRPTVENAPYDAYGKELINSALYGALLMGGGSALYQLVNGARTAEPAELLRNPTPAVAVPQKQKAKKNKPSRPRAALKAAADDNFLKSLHTFAGRLIPTQFVPDITLPSSTGPESPTVAHRGWRTAANYLAAIGGGLGGSALVNSMRDSKREKDLKDEVETARKEYFAALTGKTAEVLDAMYEKYAQQPAPQPTGDFISQMWNALPSFQDTTQRAQNVATTAANTTERAGEGLWAAALLSALGSGAVGAQYMYDQTKARTRAENLQKAQKSRARLRSIQQTPWVDPESLASIAGK